MHDIHIEVPDLMTRCFRLSPHSPLLGRSIAQSGLRSEHAVTVLAVRRGGETVGNPQSGWVFESGDVLFVFGPEHWDPSIVS